MRVYHILLGLLVAATVPVSVAGVTLDEALVKDILPPPSAKCLGAKADGDFSFSFKFKPLAKGHWHDMNVSIYILLPTSCPAVTSVQLTGRYLLLIGANILSLL